MEAIQKGKTTLTVFMVMLFLASMAFNVAPVAAQYETDPHTVGLWHFDEMGGPIAHDETMYENHGTLKPDYDPPTWTTGVFDGALSFDGIDDWIEIPDSPSLDLTNTFTLELWVNPAIDIVPGLPDYYTVLTKWTGGPPPEWFRTGYMLQFKHGRLFFYIGFGRHWSPKGYYVCVYNCFATVKESWNAGEWYHIAVTYDRGDIKMYVNGVLDSEWHTGPYHEVQPPESIAVNDLSLCINAHHDQLWHPMVTFFPGVIDEVRISNVARSPETIASHAMEGFLTLLKTDISGLSVDAFKVRRPEAAEGQRAALCNKIDAVVNQVQAGAYKGAINKLENDIKDKIEKWIKPGYRGPLLGKIDTIIATLEYLIGV